MDVLKFIYFIRKIKVKLDKHPNEFFCSIVSTEAQVIEKAANMIYNSESG